MKDFFNDLDTDIQAEAAPQIGTIFAEIAFHRSIIPTPAVKKRIVILAIKNSATAWI